MNITTKRIFWPFLFLLLCILSDYDSSVMAWSAKHQCSKACLPSDATVQSPLISANTEDINGVNLMENRCQESFQVRIFHQTIETISIRSKGVPRDRRSLIVGAFSAVLATAWNQQANAASDDMISKKLRPPTEDQPQIPFPDSRSLKVQQDILEGESANVTRSCTVS